MTHEQIIEALFAQTERQSKAIESLSSKFADLVMLREQVEAFNRQLRQRSEERKDRAFQFIQSFLPSLMPLVSIYMGKGKPANLYPQGTGQVIRPGTVVLGPETVKGQPDQAPADQVLRARQYLSALLHSFTQTEVFSVFTAEDRTGILNAEQTSTIMSFMQGNIEDFKDLHTEGKCAIDDIQKARIKQALGDKAETFLDIVTVAFKH